MVKALPMRDGKKPGASTTYVYTPQLFYKNRDPRFDKTIAYNGGTWPLNGNASYNAVGSALVFTSRFSRSVHPFQPVAASFVHV